MKRKGKGKKIFSIILCAILIMTNLLPVSIFGAGADDLQVPAYKLTDTLTAGKEYLIVSADSGSGYALTNPGGTNSDGVNMGRTAVNITQGDVDGDGTSDTYIAADQSNIVWTAAANGSRFELTNGSDYLEGKGGYVKIFSSEQYVDRGWTYADRQLKHEGGTNTYVVYYDGSSFTSTYSSSTEQVYLFEKAGVVDPPSGDTGDITPGTDNPTVSITPTSSNSPVESVSIDVGETLIITVTNSSTHSPYDFTATLNNSGVAEIQGSATVTIAQSGTGQFVVKGLTDGTVDITIQNNNSSSNRKGTIHLTVGEGGSTPVDPPSGNTVDITPSTDNPEKTANIDVGDTLVINVTNGSSNSEYDFTATLSNSGVAEIQGSATVTIAKSGTGQITVKGLTDGTVDITIQNNSSYGSQYVRKGIIHLTVGDGGSAPIDPPSGTGTNIGITSDVHGNVSGLRNWITAVQNAVEPDLDSMLYCGDFSYNMNNLESFVADYHQVVDATNALVGEGKGVYTSGNHEYYIGNREIPLSDQFTSVPGFVRIGEAVHKSNYIVYCMGAAGWYSGIGTYPDEDIAQLRAYLETAPTNIPIFIPAHFPLHMNSNRTITNADKMIELLNEHPNVIFLWGHNHSQGDSHYGQILTAGDSITYASGKSMEISFTYACAGGMYQESQTQYSGLVANISESGDTVIFQYYRTSTGAPIGSSRTINLVTAPVAGVTLDMSELTLVEGKTATLKAEVAPSNAANKRVNWSSSDSSVVSVTEKGVVKALKEGLATITVTTEEGGFTAECAVTVEPKPVGQGVNIGITSDVHGNLTGLRDWLTAVQDAVNPALDHMLYCGDYSYQTSSLDSYVSDFRDIVSATDELVGEGAGVYTSGNHEYYINGEIPLNDQFISTPGFTRIGEALSESNYIVYCLGASGWYSANGQYPDADVAALRAYLETAPADIPIFIAAHFPLHYFSSRTVTGAENVIDVLNDHPNVIFLWGHNHSQNDSHYGQILTAGDSIEYASGKSKQINFTYANAGGMYQDSQTNYSGLVANVNNAGDTVVFQYYRAATGEPIGQSRTIRIQAPAPVTTYTITAAADGNGSITPIGQIPVKAGESATFQFNPDEGYEMDTVLIDGAAVTVSGTSYTFTNVSANHSIQVSFKAIPAETWGEPTYTWAADNLHVTAERVSSFGNKETETVSAAAVTTDPTCEDQGETVYTAQFENPAFAAQTKTVTTPALGHVWGEAEYTWSEDNSSVTAIRVCTRDAAHVQTETAEAEVNVLHDPTCDTDGEAVYIVFFPLTGIERQTKVDTLPALGHAWGEAEYDWEEDGSSVTATCICERDSDHVVTETVETEEVVIILPTCVTVGRTDFTADFTKPEFTDQTETRSIPALGHIWGEAEYSWAEDYSSVTATHICTREGCTCEETETSLPIQRSISKPTCETAGQVMYIATFDNDAFTIQTEIGLVPALGHAWGEAEYVWSEDNSSVTATRVCTRDGSHTETETADVSMSITKESTCTVEGEAVYTAEFANEAFTAQTKTEVLAKLPHSYGRPVWGWDGYNTAFVILTCANCGERETIQAAITAISVEATCTETGETVYTASVEVNGKTYTDSRREILPMLEHTPGEAVREDEVPATVTAEGSYDEVVYCAVCHAELSRTHKTIDKLPIPLAINIQPYDQTVAAGKTATFTVAASGEGLTYRWQYSNDGGNSWHNKTGATATTYTVTAKTSYNGMLYRCKVTNGGGSEYTATAKLTVTAVVAPAIAAQPRAQTAAVGETAAFTVAVSGTGLQYQWQYSNNNGLTWTNKTGSTSATHTVTVKASYNGMLYRCVIKNSAGSVTTEAVRLTVDGVKPKIMTQPEDKIAAAGKTATFEVDAAGTGLTYQWQYSTDGGNTWKNKTGATSISYTVTAKASYNGILYRCRVKNSYGTVYSESAVLTVG